MNSDLLINWVLNVSRSSIKVALTDLVSVSRICASTAILLSTISESMLLTIVLSKKFDAVNHHGSLNFFTETFQTMVYRTPDEYNPNIRKYHEMQDGRDTPTSGAAPFSTPVNVDDTTISHSSLTFRLSKGQMSGPVLAGPGPLSIVENTYKFIKYTLNIFKIQIYLLNYIS